jgi:L-amino acid N-acyltransferase YncA
MVPGVGIEPTRPLGPGILSPVRLPVPPPRPRDDSKASVILRDVKLTVRRAVRPDAPAIARIYNEGIEDRVATFETRLRTSEDVERWFDGGHPAVVVERDGRILGFAATFEYRPRECYAGIAEASVYVARDARGTGAGRAALEGLMAAACEAGFWKLVSRVFPENAASLALLDRTGFRQVGRYEKHAQLDGVWRDVIIVERLLNSEF